MCSANLDLVHLEISRSLNSSSRSPIYANVSRSRSLLKLRSANHRLGFLRSQCGNRFILPIAAMGDDFMDASFGFDEGDNDPGMDSYNMMYSSGDESDTEMLVHSVGDYDLPLSKENHHHMGTPEAAVNLTLHRFGDIQRGHRKRRRTQHGVMINMGLIAFLALFLSFVDWCAWKIVRLPLEPFYLTQPFSLSTAMSACVGCLFVPISDSMRIWKMLKQHGPVRYSLRRKLPTMGGLFFVPIGIAVARGIAGISSVPVNGVALATLVFAAIGLFDDIVKFINGHSYRVPRWIKFLLQVAAGTLFSFWLCAVDIPTPYRKKFLVPLPPPHGIAFLGKYYLVMTTLCFVAMGNGLNLTDGLDGLVGGVSALAFIGMSIAVLPICPGGALTAMAACTGMFIPLFISSGVFVFEVLSVILQVLLVKAAPQLVRRALPLHYHLKLWGYKTRVIVASAYVLSGILALFAGYVGLISA